jgi:hypothetical protein
MASRSSEKHCLIIQMKMKSKRIQIEKMKKKSNYRCISCPLVKMKMKRHFRGSRVPSLAAITRRESIMGWKVTPTTI